VLVIALVFGSSAVASEPDGRVAFRYAWPDGRDGVSSAHRLELSITAVVTLTDTQLNATVPPGIALSLHATRFGAGSWPVEGLAIGDIAAGETIVIDLDVAKPAQGGGIVGFSLQASSEGLDVREGVGIPVGTPGTEPTIRNGAAEFPASRVDRAP
jgi:hypothetical protein